MIGVGILESGKLALQIRDREQSKNKATQSHGGHDTGSKGECRLTTRSRHLDHFKSKIKKKKIGWLVLLSG